MKPDQHVEPEGGLDEQAFKHRCAVLMASSGRRDLLLARSLPSICRQTCPPELVVLVDDGGQYAPAFAPMLAAQLPVELVLIPNRRAPGAAGAWNTGLEFLAARRFAGFVAMLDDDDEWDEDHLALNLKAASANSANVVISGLRLLLDGVICERTLPQQFTDRMFLVGNPGWQGSNTFVALHLLMAVGGFRDGLASANDRDLAIRLLRAPGVRVAYTNTWSATWHISSDRPTLSSPRSPAKLQGLRWFWHIYGPEMSPQEVEAFFTRAAAVFHIGQAEIMAACGSLSPHTAPQGDLLG